MALQLAPNASAQNIGHADHLTAPTSEAGRRSLFADGAGPQHGELLSPPFPGGPVWTWFLSPQPQPGRVACSPVGPGGGVGGGVTGGGVTGGGVTGGGVWPPVSVGGGVTGGGAVATCTGAGGAGAGDTGSGAETPGGGCGNGRATPGAVVCGTGFGLAAVAGSGSAGSAGSAGGAGVGARLAGCSSRTPAEIVGVETPEAATGR